MRPIPPAPPSIPELPAIETRSYRLITPLFGGGVDAGFPDERQAINAKSIRGQLRFWWRATRAAQFKSVKEMKAFEDYLWGCAASDRKKDDTADTRMAQSRVQVTVINTTGMHRQPFRARWQRKRNDDGTWKNWSWSVQLVDKSDSEYAIFPLRPPEDQTIHPEKTKAPTRVETRRTQRGQEEMEVGDWKLFGSVAHEVSFELKLQTPKHFWEGKDLTLEVNAALWAWETFGGVGARTRRGFGAITRTQQIAGDWKEHIDEGFRRYVIENEAPVGVTQLSKHYEVLPIGWQALIERFRDFRQKPGFARNPGTQANRPGRSRWPEPDAIRALTNTSANAHRDPIIRPRIDKFPRGQLGLPIIFHFQGRDDPQDQTLQPKGHERLASPLVLRPLSDHHSIAVILETKGRPSEYLLNKHPVTLEVTADEAKLIKPLNGQADVLQAALEHLKEQA
jgi:CRISPR-associated protein Cmr1